MNTEDKVTKALTNKKIQEQDEEIWKLKNMIWNLLEVFMWIGAFLCFPIITGKIIGGQMGWALETSAQIGTIIYTIGLVYMHTRAEKKKREEYNARNEQKTNT